MLKSKIAVNAVLMVSMFPIQIYVANDTVEIRIGAQTQTAENMSPLICAILIVSQRPKVPNGLTFD